MFKIFQLNFNVENRQDLDYLIICHIYKALTFGISLCIQSEACKHIDQLNAFMMLTLLLLDLSNDFKLYVIYSNRKISILLTECNTESESMV